MCSIRRAGGALAVALVLGAAGCQQAKPKVTPLADPPLVVDQAMQMRDWPLTTAEYANGDVVAGPTGQLIDVDYTERTPLKTRWQDPFIATANLFATPFVLIARPPWTQVVYEGLKLPPTYYAMPPAVMPDVPPEVVEPVVEPLTEPVEPVEPIEPVELEEVVPPQETMPPFDEQQPDVPEVPIIVPPEESMEPAPEPLVPDGGELIRGGATLPGEIEAEQPTPAPQMPDENTVDGAAGVPTAEELQEAIELPIQAPAESDGAEMDQSK